MKAKSVNENVEFQRGKDPKKVLNIGMTLERRREEAMKNLEDLRLKPKKGWFDKEEDGFWIRFPRNILTDDPDFILWYVGDNYKRFEKEHSNEYIPSNFEWSLWDPLYKRFSLNSKSLDVIINYIKKRAAREYKMAINLKNSEIKILQDILNKINKANVS